MSADSPRRSSGYSSRGMVAVPVIVPPQAVSDRSILDSAIGFINEVTLAHQPPIDPKDTITWARFETGADISDPRFGEDWELEGNVAPPLLLILGYGLGVQVWAIPANGEAVEVMSWRHGIVSALRILPTPVSAAAADENGRADEPIDAFGDKRPLIALVDGSSTSGTQPQFCAVNFISLKTGAQVKTIKFKNPVIDIQANRSSVVITFHERIAVFDARTLEDRLSITTCYPSPGINPNPVALGPRWLAYAENKLLHSKRSGGGCDGDGVASYTATVLNASKSLVKGLRELGEQVAAGLTGTSGSAGSSKSASFDSGSGNESKQSGVITIIDIKNRFSDYNNTAGVSSSSNQTAGTDTIIAHFIAHSEALVAMEFDNSGMILVTADRRGHDFHVFRIQPNPVGSSLAAVHHLYILHRGDTSAKVQNITITLDCRWVAVSTLRGTTHVFPITPYGGTMGVRTHSSLHVVNKLSRFHRSAGLSAEGRSNSPISHSESTTFTQSLQPYHNSTLPPFPRPTVVMPLAQLRQPFALGSPPGSTTLTGVKSVTGGSGSGSQRQRLSSLSDDSGKPLSVCAIFAKSRSWLLDPPNVTREAPHRMQRKAVDSLFVMAGHGALIQYDLDTKLASNVAKEKICDDTPIELEIEAKAQWNLGRRKEGSQEIMPPLSPENWLMKNRNSCILTDSTRQYNESDDCGESWLSQVEIITHAGPHRRLWMGPQFVFKTYNTPSGSNLSHVDTEAIEIGTSKASTTTASEKLDHTGPLNMPLAAAGRSSAVPVLIESGSYSSIEQSPKLMDRFRHDHLDSDFSIAHGDSRLKEDLADAMRETPCSTTKDTGGHACENTGSKDNVAFYDDVTSKNDERNFEARCASAAALANALPNIHSYDKRLNYESLDTTKKPKLSIEKIVNPLGTVTTVTSCLTADVKTDILDEVVSQLAAEETIIHENCDESLFRPVVAIFCDEKTLLQSEEEARKKNEQYQPPEIMSNKLVVPVIAKEINDEMKKREKQKSIKLSTKPCTKNIAEEIIPKVAQVDECKMPNLKDDEPTGTRDSQKCNEQKKKHKKNEDWSQNASASKNVLVKSTKPKCEIPSHVVFKVELDNHDNVHKSIKSEEQEVDITELMCDDTDKFTKLKSQTKMDLKKLSKNKTENSYTPTTNDNKDNIKRKTNATVNEDKNATIEQQHEENTNISEISKNGLEDKKTAACISSKKEEKESITIDVDCQTTLKNMEDNLSKHEFSKSHSSIITNTAIKEKVKKSKNNIKINKSDETNINIVSQHNDHQYTGHVIDENIQETKTKTIEYEKSKSVKSKLKLEDAQPMDKPIYIKDKPQQPSSEGQMIKPSTNNKNLLEITENYQSKMKCEDINFNKELSLKVHKTSISDVKDVNEAVSSEINGKDKPIIKSEVIDKIKKEIDKVKLVEIEKWPEGLNTVNDNCSLSLKAEKNDKRDENLTINEVKDGQNRYQLENANSEIKNEESKCEVNIKIKSLKTKESPRVISESHILENEKKNDSLSTSSTKIKSNAFLKNEKKKEIDISNEISPVSSVFNKEYLDSEDYIKQRKNNTSKQHLGENTLVTCETIVNNDETTSQMPKSAWKTLSGAEMISKNLKKTNDVCIKYPLLDDTNKYNVQDKLLPELPTPNEMKVQTNLDQFSVLKPLDSLPPLPALEPLELMTEAKGNSHREISLINFESPLQENPSLERRIIPNPRGFTEDNLILALCGSLHYEHEHGLISTETMELSPTFSSNPSLVGLEEPSLADYKSLTENEDPYMSLEQSSQDTNTTNTTNTTNEKFSSSTNSSGSEEVIIMEEKKMTKKQKRKKQQQLNEFQKQKEQQKQQEIDDEELRPLIAVTDSQVNRTVNSSHKSTELALECNNDKPLTQHFINSNTTDSDGPMPATTSDDNVCSISVPIGHNPHKIKTKKLEHKINLIAAIEAATSSSTSSAEESGVELGHRPSHDNDESLITVSNNIISTTPLPVATTSQTAVGVSKKKTKRHKFETNDDTSNMYHIQQNSDNRTSNVSANKKVNYKILNELNNTQIKSQETDKGNFSQQIEEAHSVKQQNNKQHQQLQYLTNNAIDNCFAKDGTSTIVNIDIFDDQLSTSTNSNTSHFSCEAGPISTTTPPISLNGAIDTNLMYFSPSSAQTLYSEPSECECLRLSEGDSTIEQNNDSSGHNNSSNESGGSL